MKIQERLHTLIYTFRLEPNIQYLGLNQENAESLAPLFSSQHILPEQILGKYALRDVISSFVVIELG